MCVSDQGQCWKRKLGHLHFSICDTSFGVWAELSSTALIPNRGRSLVNTGELHQPRWPTGNKRTFLTQGVDLVLDKREERRDDQCEPLGNETGQLETLKQDQRQCATLRS